MRFEVIKTLTVTLQRTFDNGVSFPFDHTRRLIYILHAKRGRQRIFDFYTFTLFGIKITYLL